jgi:hypothetical protein
MKMKSESLYYFNDSRIQYSAEHIRSMMEDGIIEPTTTVHTICLPFKASDVVQHIAPVVSNFLLSDADEGTTSVCDLADAVGMGKVKL